MSASAQGPEQPCFIDNPACECCDRTMPDYNSAIEAGWNVGWDGWICPTCNTVPTIQ